MNKEKRAKYIDSLANRYCVLNRSEKAMFMKFILKRNSEIQENEKRKESKNAAKLIDTTIE